MNARETSHEDLANALSELFCEEVDFSVHEQKQLGEAALLVIAMEYTRRSEQTVHVSQTAVVLVDPELDLPQFALRPKLKGITGLLFGRLLGMGDIHFNDSPAFSDAYHVHGWNEQAVRLLLPRQIRDHFSDHPGWSARGVRQHLVVFKQDQICESGEMDSFVDESLKILRLFQEGEEVLDERPDVRRDASIDDVVATAERMSGIHAMLIKKELQKSHVSAAELDAFLGQPTPRSNAPKGLRHLVGGGNLMLIVLGAVFYIAGIVLPTLIWLYAQPDERLIAIPFAVMFPLIGGAMLAFAIPYRRRRKRLLRSGILATGKVTKVKRTNVQVNNAQRYHLHATYQINGKSQSAVANLYSNIEKAREFATTGKSVRLLVDPKNHERFLCVDTLLIFD